MTTTAQRAGERDSLGRRGGVDGFFRLTERGSSVWQEVRGGVVTFFTMAYIILLNPIILGSAKDVHGHTLSLAQLEASTVVVALLATLFMGIGANLPLALAAGLGLNGVVAFTLAPVMTWPEAMGLVVVEGVGVFLLAATGARQIIMNAIPMSIKKAIGAGIGLFIAFIGLNDAGVVTPGNGTPVQLGTAGQLNGWPVFVFVIGLLLMLVLWSRRLKGAILISIVVTTILAIIVNAVADVPAKSWGLVVPKLPHTWVSTPDLGLLGHVSVFGAFTRVPVVTVLVFLFTLILSDFFDAMGTIVGISDKAGLLDENGQVPRIKAALMIDGLAAVAGGAGSSSSATAYIESSAGVTEGARTGLASVVTAICFGGALFLTPLYQIVPQQAATTALVLVGFLMLSELRHIEWDDYGISIPVFLTVILMPFTYSITNGVGAGIISFALINTLGVRATKRHHVSPLMWVLALLFSAYFLLSPIEHVFHMVV